MHQTLNLQQLPPNQNCEEVHQLNQFEFVDTVYDFTAATTYYEIVDSHLLIVMSHDSCGQSGQILAFGHCQVSVGVLWEAIGSKQL